MSEDEPRLSLDGEQVDVVRCYPAPLGREGYVLYLSVKNGPNIPFSVSEGEYETFREEIIEDGYGEVG